MGAVNPIGLRPSPSSLIRQVQLRLDLMLKCSGGPCGRIIAWIPAYAGIGGETLTIIKTGDFRTIHLIRGEIKLSRKKPGSQAQGMCLCVGNGVGEVG